MAHKLDPQLRHTFRIPFLLNLLPSYVPGESIDCLHPVFVDGVRLRPVLPRTRHSQLLHLNPLRVGAIFGASWFAHLVRPAELLASLADRTNVPIGLQRLLLPSFRSSRSPSSPSDITTVASGYLHRQDFHLLERPLASLHQGFGSNLTTGCEHQVNGRPLCRQRGTLSLSGFIHQGAPRPINNQNEEASTGLTPANSEKEIDARLR